MIGIVNATVEVELNAEYFKGSILEMEILQDRGNSSEPRSNNRAGWGLSPHGCALCMGPCVI